MHAAVLVITKENDLLEVSSAMEPFGEPDWQNEDDDRYYRWDWWQVGGRWTGFFSGYDPTTDPANLEKCKLCDGTGKRPPDEFVPSGLDPCNGCEGKGERTKWPTEWVGHPGDTQPIEAIVADPSRVLSAIVFYDEDEPEPRWRWLEMASNSPFSPTAEEDEVWRTTWHEVLTNHIDEFGTVIDYHM